MLAGVQRFGAQWVEDFPVCLTFLFCLFYSVTTTLWFFFYYNNGIVNKRTLNFSKIQPLKKYTTAVMKEELYYSTITVFIGSALMACVVSAYKLDIALLFWHPAQHGYFYYFVSVAAMFAFNDAYMYWIHRFFHTRIGFKIHKVHHRFFAPTPFATMANHPIESFVLFLPVLLAIGPVPVHLPTLYVLFAFQVSLSISDHLGFKLPFFEKAAKILSTPLHHDLHHSVYRCNYGVYFTFWDRWMGTLVDDSLTEAHRDVIRRTQGVDLASGKEKCP